VLVGTVWGAKSLAEQAKLFNHKVIWENNAFVQCVVGANSAYLKLVEARVCVRIGLRGNEVFLRGRKEDVEQAVGALNAAYDIVAKGRVLDQSMIRAILKSDASDLRTPLMVVKNKPIYARTKKQWDMINALEKHDLVFALGVAGTGKTYLAVVYGLQCLLNGQVKRLILTRPAVEAGEQLGFLPGDMKEKVDPYMMPLYDALHDICDMRRVQQLIESNKVEVAPLAFMRGRTLSNSFIILDEAQNATCAQMKMFLTRLGEHSRMVITGDPDQTDLMVSQKSGLMDAVRRLCEIPGISLVRFGTNDVVRHNLVTKILNAYGS